MLMTTTTRELSADQLRRICDPGIFAFQSTEELPLLEEVIGQERAVRAISFGIDIESSGYHMYALGPVGTGKATTIKEFLDRKAVDRPIPDDWCYVYNFDNPDKPQAIRLTAGKGRAFHGDVERLVADLRVEIKQALESEEYNREKQQVQESFEKQRQELFAELESSAQARDFVLVQTPLGVSFAPVVDGQMVSPLDIDKLDEEQRRRINAQLETLQSEMRDTMRRLRQLQVTIREQLHELDRQVASYAVDHLIEGVKQKYAEFDDVVKFLTDMRADILDNVQVIKQSEQQEREEAPAALLMGKSRSPLDRYGVNLLVDNSDTHGAPVIVEGHPHYHNLLGRIEHEVHLGALITDVTMIKAGALHRANGGYLIVEAHDILTKPFVWEALKRALKSHTIQIEMMGQEYQTLATRTLEPEPIPLEVKVIVIGDPLLYYLLHSLDADFQELFKVKADFAVDVAWSEQTTQQYAAFIGTICHKDNLPHFDPFGVAKIVEYSARLISDRTKLATKFGEISDVIREASYWAQQSGHPLVSVVDVQRAIGEKVYRSNKMKERIQELIEDGTLLIDTTGEVVGQVNGISVISLGDYDFGKPSRITARTYIGGGGVISIDRESELGGPIHKKGTMILIGYLGGQFAEDTPLTLSASITFEQLYEGVEGDSAASAELYALLSSLADIPIRQELAVTGSINQRGQIQAIGGVNEKIEGFFDVCKLKGLTGRQGVIIPTSNIKNLMLREDVVASVEAGQFHIYGVSTIDEGIELLTGKEAGTRQPDGTYPEGTVYRAVQDRLREMAELARRYAPDELRQASKSRK
jgi:lon-related putative ATP-dependent protease